MRKYKSKQEIIQIIGQNESALNFVNSKIIALLCLDVIFTMLFLFILFVSFSEKDILFIICSLILFLIFMSNIIENIITINSLQKEKINLK